MVMVIGGLDDDGRSINMKFVPMPVGWLCGDFGYKKSHKN